MVNKSRNIGTVRIQYQHKHGAYILVRRVGIYVCPNDPLRFFLNACTAYAQGLDSSGDGGGSAGVLGAGQHLAVAEHADARPEAQACAGQSLPRVLAVVQRVLVDHQDQPEAG